MDRGRLGILPGGLLNGRIDLVKLVSQSGFYRRLQLHFVKDVRLRQRC